ncbi:hypothetical protein SDC9_174233 [bioreactor metagenome]|uniref:Uncharacterized protein n=1 Tax=bioreactor metagenome TaxID=1076179 RepID=A0A645GIQ1_9ZZZZ
MDVGAGLLRETNGVEPLELRDARADGLGVIGPQRGAVCVGQLPQEGGGEGIAHGVRFEGSIREGQTRLQWVNDRWLMIFSRIL